MSKVIKIIDAYNILISRDEDFKNIKINSVLEIYSKGPEIIYENQNYGTLDLVKAELRVKEVFPKMLLCENNKYTKIKVTIPIDDNNLALKKNKNLFPDNISKLMAYPLFKNNFNNTLPKNKTEEVEKIVPLKIDETQIDKNIKLNESLTIKLGDPVRLKEDYK